MKSIREGTGKNPKLRLKLWRADPRCHWCGIITVNIAPSDGRLPDNAATLDHFRNKMDPLRDQVADEPHAVLACAKCNHERGRQHEREFLEKRWDELGRPPSLTASVAEILGLDHI